MYIGVHSYYFLFTVYGFVRIIGKHAKPFLPKQSLTRSFLTAHECIWVDLPQQPTTWSTKRNVQYNNIQKPRRSKNLKLEHSM